MICEEYMLSLSILQRALLIYKWQDFFEILVMSSVLYKIIIILAQDTQKPLLRNFYLYLSLVFIAYSYDCLTLQILLLISAPALLTFFILIHQETLQKNFVALYRPAITVKKEPWHHSLIQLCQKQASKNQSLSCIIEKKQNLESLVIGGVTCHSSFSFAFCEILCASPLLFTEQFILFEHDGTIRRINAEIYPHGILHHEFSENERELFLTAKTDALILKMDSHTLTFTCIHNNKKVAHLSAHTTQNILNAFFEIKTHTLEGSMYAHIFDNKYKKTELS